MFLAFVLRNDHVLGVAKPMIIDLNQVKIKGFEVVFKIIE
jgi:hypothetical protein